jgi:hypothetical protein
METPKPKSKCSQCDSEDILPVVCVNPGLFVRRWRIAVVTCLSTPAKSVTRTFAHGSFDVSGENMLDSDTLAVYGPPRMEKNDCGGFICNAPKSSMPTATFTRIMKK